LLQPSLFLLILILSLSQSKEKTAFDKKWFYRHFVLFSGAFSEFYQQNAQLYFSCVFAFSSEEGTEIPNINRFFPIQVLDNC